MIVTEIEAYDLLSELGQENVISYEAESQTITTIVTALLAKQLRTPAITLGTIHADYASLERSIKVDGDSILRALLRLRDTVGGYLSVDTSLDLQWDKTIGSDTGQQIRYAKNLTGITRSIDYTKLCNRLYAYGQGEGDEARIKLSDADGYALDYVENAASQTEWDGIYIKVLTEKSITHPNTLKSWADLKLDDLKDPPITYQVDTIDLYEVDREKFVFDALTLGSTVMVIDEDLGISVETTVVSIEHPDLVNPMEMTIELSNKTRDIADSLLDIYDKQQFESHVATVIGAGQVTINGTVFITDWISGGTTTINGAQITTGTVTLTQLSFVPLSSSGATGDVIATINASAEGITIDADKVSINAGKRIYKQASIPTSNSEGDIWFDSDDDNKLYRAACAGADQIIAGEWELVADDRISTNAGNITANADQISLNVTSITNNEGGITTNAAAITVNADNINLRVEKDDVINQINISTEGVTIDGDNIEINGLTTFAAGSPAIIDIIEDLASNAASGQKDIVLASAAAAARYSAGDVILLGDDTNSESCEIASIATVTLTMVANLTNSYTTAANAYVVKYGAADNINNGVTTINGGLITTNTINANTLTTSTLTSRTITLGADGKFVTGAVDTNRIEITNTALIGYDNANVYQFKLDASDGKAYAGAGGLILDDVGATFKDETAIFQDINGVERGRIYGSAAGSSFVLTGANIHIMASSASTLKNPSCSVKSTTLTTITRALSTDGTPAIYQNGDYLRFITVSIDVGVTTSNGGRFSIYIGATSSPSTIVGNIEMDDDAVNLRYSMMSFIVPPHWYYRVYDRIDDGASVQEWMEIDLCSP